MQRFHIQDKHNGAITKTFKKLKNESVEIHRTTSRSADNYKSKRNIFCTRQHLEKNICNLPKKAEAKRVEIR